MAPRPIAEEDAPSENVAAWLARIGPLVEGLSEDENINERTAEQQACWILANLLDFHRREDKAVR